MASAQIHSIHSRQLIALGRALQPPNAAAATGRCLATVLDVAARARERRIAVELVRWQLRGDPDHADHWAVRLDAERVIDPTRVQVDGTSRLVCRLDDYPVHYLPARVYPASILLQLYRKHGEGAGTPHLPGRLLFGCHARLFGFDALRALGRGDARDLLASLAEFGRFALSFALRTFGRRLQARAAVLRRRLDGMGAEGTAASPARPGAATERPVPAGRRAGA